MSCISLTFEHDRGKFNLLKSVINKTLHGHIYRSFKKTLDEIISFLVNYFWHLYFFSKNSRGCFVCTLSYTSFLKSCFYASCSVSMGQGLQRNSSMESHACCLEWKDLELKINIFYEIHSRALYGHMLWPESILITCNFNTRLWDVSALINDTVQFCSWDISVFFMVLTPERYVGLGIGCIVGHFEFDLSVV